MSEIEIKKSAIYNVGGLKIQGNELISKVADGFKYELLREKRGGANNE